MLNEWGLAEKPAQGLGQAAATTPPSTTTTTAIGAVLGGAVGALGGRAFKKKHTLLGGAIGAAVGAGAGYYYGSSQNPATYTAPSGPGGGPYIPVGQNGSINPLVSGSQNLGNVSATGGVATITLPPAPARLGTVSVAAPASGTTSTATYNIIAGNAPTATSPSGVAGSLLTGTNTITITWTDSQNNSLTSTVTVNVG